MRWFFLALPFLPLLLFINVFHYSFSPLIRSFKRRISAGLPEIVFVLAVCVIVGHALVFSFLYITEELFLKGLIFATALLALSMFLLITRDSFLSLLLGWDGLGISSFFLVIWYQRWNRVDSGIITFLSNRVGDFFLLLRTTLFLSRGRWLNNSWSTNFCFSFLVAIACLTKRAQVPFRVWLPIAISAPTPISALVHSRTLVTAGLFLVIKFQCLLSASLLFFIGATTIIVAGGIRILEIDLKKIVALSTLSQLGLLIRRLGAGAFALTFFHIIRHALIKSALLIVVGILLHKNLGSQDKRIIKWGGKTQRYSFLCLILCSLSLCGVSLTRGAVSKEMLLLNRNRSVLPSPAAWYFLTGVALTLIYCARLILVSFQTPEKRIRTRGWARKEAGRSLLLVFLSCVLGTRLIERLSVSRGNIRLREAKILLLLFSFATIIGVSSSFINIPLTMFYAGAEVPFKITTRSLKGWRRGDRVFIDRANWFLFLWTDIFHSGSSKRKKRAFYFLVLFFIRRCLFL